MLNLTGTSKTYPGVVHEMQDIHLDVPRGMFGLLGPKWRGQVVADAHDRYVATTR